ncbi:tetratricopeptide repeat protein [Luteimonas pelagia]
MIVIAWLAGACALSGCTEGGDGMPRAYVPESRDHIVEHLPEGFSSGSQDGEPDSPADRVETLLALAATTGDGRFAGRASALLESLPREQLRSVRMQGLHASVLQHGHRFEDAGTLLDAAIRSAPRDGELRLARAQLRLVQGRIRAAREDCRALAVGLDAARGLVCTAAVELRVGRYRQAGELLDLSLSQAMPMPDAATYVLLMRAEAASRAKQAEVADAWFTRALRASPGDARVLVAWSRHLRRTERPEAALEMLGTARGQGVIRVQRALAGVEAGAAGAIDACRALAREFARLRRAGAVPEARDEAALILACGEDPGRALALALENFECQRDHEDVAVLVDAARAAGRPEAVDAARAWASREGVPVEAMVQ